jgi:membrane-associated phospholipid phosphatase
MNININKHVSQTFHYIGIYAPVLLFVISVLLLRHTPVFLRVFVSGVVLNNIANLVLKMAIREPRPSKDQKAGEIGVVDGERSTFDKFGMPSGHAQNCGFFVAFITMVLNNPYVTGLYSVVSVITLFQRYLYNNHTFLQLLFGFIIGGSIGYVIYVMGYMYLQGNIETSKDDEYYF